MADFKVLLTNRAIADVDRLPVRVRLQVINEIAEIASLVRDPLPPRSGSKKLKAYRPPLYRLRAGDGGAEALVAVAQQAKELYTKF